MRDRIEVKRQVIGWVQRHIANPLARRLPNQALIETIGRRSGLLRHTPIGGRRVGDSFWFVSEFGHRSDYIRNIAADPNVRVRIRGRWHSGTAHLIPTDDARRRLRDLPRINSGGVLIIGADLLTVRVDLDPAGSEAA
ncbi:nitroreductase family deazaflavin-dependent oxidoreductase [Nocardia sp. NBC_01499]|uniref:nitroreductase/quinone reductase family protein n=1 Tax=Nocardia sp. NBC_01499 TaxID=2903597 RepID=UPI0038695006